MGNPVTSVTYDQSLLFPTKSNLTSLDTVTVQCPVSHVYERAHTYEKKNLHFKRPAMACIHFKAATQTKALPSCKCLPEWFLVWSPTWQLAVFLWVLFKIPGRASDKFCLMLHFEKKEKGEKQTSVAWKETSFYSHDGSGSTHDHTLEHPVSSSSKRASGSLFLPSLTVRDTRLLSSRPPTPAPSPFWRSDSFLFPTAPSLAPLLSDKMHIAPRSLSSLFSDIFPPPTHNFCSMKTNISRWYY